MLTLLLIKFKVAVIGPRISPVLHKRFLSWTRARGFDNCDGLRHWNEHALSELLLPSNATRAHERSAVVHLDGQKQIRPRPDVVTKSGVGLATASENKHDRPVSTPKHSAKMSAHRFR